MYDLATKRSTGGHWRYHANVVFRRFVCMLLAWVTTIASSQALRAQDFIDQTPKIKAAYIFQLIRYVEWPADAFQSSNSPLVIGVVGTDRVKPILQLISQKRNAGARKLVIKDITSIQDAQSCHIVYFAQGTPDETIDSVLAGLKENPVLLVAEADRFVQRGGVIGFVPVGNKLRLRLSTKNATQHRLKISSQLAKLAEVVN